MNEKKFTIVFFCIVETFFLINVFLWHIVVKPTFYDHDGHGDMARLGGYNCAPSMTKLPQYAGKHIKFTDYLGMDEKPKIDIVTVGDSYSNGAAGSWYQDYLAERYGKTVLHINIAGYEAAELLRLMVQNGLLQEIAPKAVILESVERKIQIRFGSGDIKVPEISKEQILQRYASKNDGTKKLPSQQEKTQANWLNIIKLIQIPNVMVEANKRYFYNKLKYANNNKQISDDVNRENLNSPFFTNRGQENLLLFYHDEFWYKDAKIDYAKINQTINALSDDCSQHGMQLVFMICADKFDLYYPYINDKGFYAENPFFEEFEKYPKRYIFVNTKKILQPLLEAGEKDVYWMDDTHWSWKGQERVVDVLMKELTDEGVL